MNRTIPALCAALVVASGMLPAQEWDIHTAADGLGGDLAYAVAFNNNTGQTWCGSYDGRLGSLAAGSGIWSAVDARSSSLPAYGGAGVAVDGQGNVWFGTSHGLAVYNGSSFTRYDADDELPHNSVRAVLCDRSGGIWAATLGGIARYTGSAWQIYRTADGLADDQVFSLAENGSGHIWAGSMTGISEFDGSAWHKRHSADWVTSLTVDTQGDVWGGFQDGICRYNGSSWAVTDGIAGDGSDKIHTVRAAAADMTGNVWFALTRTVWDDGASAYRDLQNVLRWDGSSWTVFDSTDGLASGFVRCIGIDRNNVKWFGTDKGLTSYSADFVGMTAPGLPDLLLRPNPFTTAIRISLPPDITTHKAEIFDGNGQRLVVLVPDAGGAVYWNGTDEAGTPLPRGIYFCRVGSASGPYTVKVVKED